MHGFSDSGQNKSALKLCIIIFSCQQQNPFSALHQSSNFHRVQAAPSRFYETKEFGGRSDYLPP